ncbi:MAG: hypothetical protein WBE13_13725 [Candidatus Acidiferrum sp.]
MSTSNNQQLREKLLALLGDDTTRRTEAFTRADNIPAQHEKEAPQETSIPLPPSQSVVAARGDCPQCGDWMRSIGGPGKRCQACGHQPKVNQAMGISRAAIDDYEGGRADFHPKGFAMAMARMVGFGRR